MKTTKTKRIGLMALLGIILLGLTATNVAAFEVLLKQDLVKTVIAEQDLVKIADNFIILFDSASSMADTYKNTSITKLDAEKMILAYKNAALPDLGYNAGLYTFTPKAFSLTLKALKPFYEMKPYNRADFANAIEQLPKKASGPTLLQQGLHDLESILAGLSGRTAVFVFTDGQYSKGSGLNPTQIARKLADKHNVCFYVISNAPGAVEHQLLKEVASVNACSRVIPLEAMLGRPENILGALYVVVDILTVQEDTVTKVAAVKMDNILFDFNSTAISPESKEELNGLGQFLQNNSKPYVIFSGFSDATGPAEYNLALSRQRAESAAVYLVENFNIDPFRIVTLWYGDNNPVAGNDTPAGRSKNRRVVGIVAGFEGN